MSAALKNPFKATVIASVNELDKLLIALKDEQAALTGRQPEALEQAVKRKLEILRELEHGVKARDQILKQAGCKDGLQGSEQFIRQYFSPEEILADWKRLVSLSREVDKINTHNGKLAASGERTTRQALGILTGRSSESNTYTRKRKRAGTLAPGVTLGKC